MGSIDLAHDVIHFIQTYLASVVQIESVLKKSLLLWKDTGNLNISKHKRILLEIEGRRLAFHDMACRRPASDITKQRVISDSRLITPYHDGINASCIETHHVELLKVRLYLDVRDIYIPFEGIPAEHIDTLSDDVTDIVHIHISTPGI